MRYLCLTMLLIVSLCASSNGAETAEKENPLFDTDTTLFSDSRRERSEEKESEEKKGRGVFLDLPALEDNVSEKETTGTNKPRVAPEWVSYDQNTGLPDVVPSDAKGEFN